MNTPNKLSLIRIGCIPLIVLMMSLSEPWCRWAAVFLFAFASFTDFLDGHLARKHNLITDFGKFIDPVADKLLVLSTFIMLSDQKLLPAWFIIVILARELAVDGLRLVAMTKNLVIAAGPFGKIKTFSQMLLILYLMVFRLPFSHWLTLVFAVWVLFATVYSGIDYFLKNRSVFAS
ncbi:MAG: CDP-diacylglycerol--glycerol-3-phosphate 3-phosphatidyltransferase [Clostridia bacterium]|nr:CDP-diacylglycerol--glycerol-3-phosphate 3-phosphatidyltransferase [Clostridia bacterium]